MAKTVNRWLVLPAMAVLLAAACGESDEEESSDTLLPRLEYAYERCGADGTATYDNDEDVLTLGQPTYPFANIDTLGCLNLYLDLSTGHIGREGNATGHYTENGILLVWKTGPLNAAGGTQLVSLALNDPAELTFGEHEDLYGS